VTISGGGYVPTGAYTSNVFDEAEAAVSNWGAAGAASVGGFRLTRCLR